MKSKIHIFILIIIIFLSFTSCEAKKAENIYYSSIDAWVNNQYEDAIQSFISLTRIYPKNELVDDSFFWIASIYHYYLKQSKQAIYYYKILIKSFPESEFYAKSNFSIAQIYEKGGKNDIENAIYTYQDIINYKNTTDKQEIESYKAIAKNYIKIKQYKNARFILKKMYQKYSSNEEILDNIYSLIALSYSQEGKIKLASATYEEAILKVRKNSLKENNYYKLAKVYENQGRLKDSIQLYQKLLDTSGIHNRQKYSFKLKSLQARIRKTTK